MHPISIFDSNLILQAQIDDYEYLRWNFRYRNVDQFEIRINRYKNNTEYLDTGNIVALYINESYRAGLIEAKELSLTPEGKISESWIINGRGLDGLVAERIAMNATGSGTGYDSQTGVAETLMRHYVNINCISSSVTNRNYTDLELETDQLRGASVKYEARFQQLDTILGDLSLASGLGWTVVLDTSDKKFKFRILEGLDRSWENGVNAPVMFSPGFGNIKLLGYRKTRMGSKTNAYVAGQGEAELRTVQEVALDGGTYTNLNRREFFVDARDLDATDKLTQRGNEKLAEVGIEEIIEMENLADGPFEFGPDFDIGDIVTVKYPDITEANARIIESVLEITTQEIHNKLVIGRQYPDLISIIKKQNENISAEVRK